MAIFNSNEFVLTIQLNEDELNESNIPFAHSTDCSLSFTNNLVEATLGVTNGWTEHISGKKTTNINFSGLYDYGTVTDKYNTEDLGDYLLDQQKIYFNIGHLVDNSYQGFEYGAGYISEISLEGGTDDVAKYSGVLTVTEELGEELEATMEAIQDSDGNDILDDFGLPIYAKIK